MRFTVPQFIEYEAKILGPLTFRQFTFVGLAGAICFVLYYSIGKTDPFIFFTLSFCLIGGALGLGFVKIGGRELPVILTNLFIFNLSPKIYLWKKSTKAEVVYQREVSVQKKENIEETPLKIAGNSQLKKIQTRIETNLEKNRA